MTKRKNQKTHIRVFFILLFTLTSVNAQCSSVSSTENPSENICASLHIYKDNTYSERDLSPRLTTGDWIFAGVVTNVPVGLYDCWLTASETGQSYSIIQKGCVQEATYYVQQITSTNFYKFYGKFLQFTTDSEKTFQLKCNVTTDCPIYSGCELLCSKNPPSRYLVEAEDIKLSENTGTTTQVNYVIILVVIAAVFLLLLLILVVAFVVRMKRKREKRRQARDATPVLLDSSATSSVRQNGHVSIAGTNETEFNAAQGTVDDPPLYSVVRNGNKNVDDTTM